MRKLTALFVASTLALARLTWPMPLVPPTTSSFLPLKKVFIF